MPYDGSVELNLISLHPALIDFARALLGVEEVHCYQSHTWAKFTGLTDYEQEFHCDFHNHTLTVPSDDHAARTVDFVFYLTDVTEGNGALRYVTKPDVIKAIGRPALAAYSDEEQESLRRYERKVEVSAGGLVAHGIDTMHRGANLLEPGGRRFSMTVGYKAAGNDNIQYHVGQTAADKDWLKIINHATPEQLTALGIPKPGDKFWSLRTLKLMQARWPDLDMTAYFSASGF
jgi:ectoine hydroxylase-related dioxygenase (phytanoyl-CoA dioxygenase family)